jgi:Tol biopolymer transport system component
MATPNFGELVKLNRSVPEDFSFNGKTTRASLLYGEVPFGGKLPNQSISTVPANTGRVVSWHPSGRLLVVGHDTTPHFSAYYFTGTSLTKVANPAYISPGTTNAAKWSPDGKFLFVGSSDTPNMLVYSLDLSASAPFLTKVAEANEVGFSDAHWSPDSKYLVVTNLNLGATSNWIKIYPFDGTSFGAPILPSGPISSSLKFATSVAWSECGRYISAGYFGPGATSTSYLAVYAFSGSTFSEITTAVGANALPSWVSGVAWSPDSKYLAASHNSGYKSTVYSFENDSLTKLNTSGVAPSGVGLAVDWSPDGRHYAVTTDTTPYLVVYVFEDQTIYYTLYAYVSGALPVGSANDVSWSPDGKFVAVAHSGHPHLTVYTSSTGTIRPGNMLNIEPPSNLPHI